MEINTILLSKSSDVSLHNERFRDKDNVLTHLDREKLLKLSNDTENHWISKYDGKVVYELYGFLDNRYGIIYSQKPLNDSTKEIITDNWYLYFFPH